MLKAIVDVAKKSLKTRRQWRSSNCAAWTFFWRKKFTAEKLV